MNMVTEVRSRNSTQRGSPDDNARRGTSPGAYASPDGPRYRGRSDQMPPNAPTREEMLPGPAMGGNPTPAADSRRR
jgi:hypothetical protein